MGDELFFLIDLYIYPYKNPNKAFIICSYLAIERLLNRLLLCATFYACAGIQDEIHNPAF